MRRFLLSLLLFVSLSASSQPLQSGFDKSEYLEILRIYSRWAADSVYYKGIPVSTVYKSIYRSAPLGLDNCWELYVSKEKRAVISIRGTSGKEESWLENFYGAMVPATGVLKLSSTFSFTYSLSSLPTASVHTGWLIGTAYLGRDILPRLDSLYQAGYRDFIITGHSQGGAISYLLTSYLLSLQESGGLAKDIRFKTYCSAAPKPGNLYYAESFEAATYPGWAYNVINAADWVPETPNSIQTTKDYTTVNPFRDLSLFYGTQGGLKGMILKLIYKRMTRPVHKAASRTNRNFGVRMSEQVKKYLPEHETPSFSPTQLFVRTGHTISLIPDKEYYKEFPDSKENVFIHHLLRPYYHLAKKLPD